MDAFKEFNATILTFGQSSSIGYDVNDRNAVNAVGSSNRLMYIAMNQGSNTPYTGKSGHAGKRKTKKAAASGRGPSPTVL